MVVVSGNTLVDGRPREHNGNSTEFKFVFKSNSGEVARTTDLVALMSSLSKMRTGTSERSAAEFWLIPMECGWVKSKDKNKNKEQGTKKGIIKGKGKENPKSGELAELRSNCRKWGHNVASGWHGEEKQVNRVRSKAGTVSLSSSSSTLVATDVDTKHLGVIESRSENAGKSWLCMVVGFVAINPFSMGSVTSVHVCPKSSAAHATLSLKVWSMRGVVYNEMDLHGEVCTKRPMLSMIWWEIDGFHLTVGDGCRKLGGHGREMILRRNGDSHLVNVEFEDELQGCKKPMSRDLACLMTHGNSGVAGHSATADVGENSDVAGYSVAAVVDERRVASSTIELPRCEAVESQKSAQVPAAPLCCAWIVGRSREAPTQQPL